MRVFLRLPALVAFMSLMPLAYGQTTPPAGNMQDMKMQQPMSGTNAPGNQAMPGMQMQDMPGMGMMEMPSSVDLLSAMSQEASGTAWLPYSTPVYGKMWMHGSDMLMLHGDMHLRYTDVGSLRGDRRFDAPNWFMGMYSHPLSSKDQLGFRAMMSLDPITEKGFGYPLLFQTGETWQGIPLHDRQHPHDLFDELSLTYSRKLSERNSAYLYFAYPGEPALGPPTYMHRLIAYDLADAPIGHHWQDATHITFGVGTAGFNFGNRLKLESSVFTGREPDEDRYNFDPARFDSYSRRLSYNPDDNDALQVSYGFIRNPEGNGVNQHRITASWIYNRPSGPDANFTTSLVWGQNILPGEGPSNSYLAEADYQHGRDTLFGRFENIDKSGDELVLPAAYGAQLFNLNALTLGYVRDLTHGSGLDTGLGAAVTIDTMPGALDAFYGSGAPLSFQIFLRIRPSRMGSHAQDMTKQETGKNNAMTQTPEQANITLTATIFPDAPKVRQKSTLIIRLSDSTGKPVTGAKIRSGVEMTSMDMGTEHPAFKEMGDGRYQGMVSFSMAGPWRVTLIIALPGQKVLVKKSLNYEAAP